MSKNNYHFNLYKKKILKFRPTTNKYGQSKHPYDSKELIYVNSNLFNIPSLLSWWSWVRAPHWALF